MVAGPSSRQIRHSGMRVEIDAHSGFCGGVIRAIDKAEQVLSRTGHLYSLGDMVHNEAELRRLGGKGLVSLDRGDIRNLPRGESLLIRAHGEPPETYAEAEARGLHIIDCTCPVVLNIQKSIREAHAKGRILIFGKIGHAEVLGLIGQAGGDASVVENLGQLKDLIGRGELDLSRHLEVFSQTTMNPVAYDELCRYLAEKASDLTVHGTICRQVASRHERLGDFARSHDAIVFVSGSTSSNGKVLSELCRRENSRTYNVSGPEEIDPGWFCPGDFVGICGATSTPKWLLEKVAGHIKNLH